MLNQLKDGPAHVGLKQSKRALQEGNVAKAFGRRGRPTLTSRRAFVADVLLRGWR